MGVKGPGGGSSGAKHSKAFEEAEDVAHVLVSDEAWSRFGAANRGGVAAVHTTRNSHTEMMVDIIAWVGLNQCNTTGFAEERSSNLVSSTRACHMVRSSGYQTQAHPGSRSGGRSCAGVACVQGHAGRSHVIRLRD